MSWLEYLVRRITATLRGSGNVLKVGDRVVLNCPENVRLHTKTATVKQLTEWGAHVSCEAAFSGSYRALFAEMESPHKARPPAPTAGYTGDVCSRCGSSRMRRAGTCAVCEECGETTGCG